MLAIGAGAQGSWASAIEADFIYVMQISFGTISENWSLAQWRATASNSPDLYRKAIIQVLDVAPRLIPCAEARAQDAMLAEAFHVEGNSRLGCQIQMTPEINGLEVTLAPES